MAVREAVINAVAHTDYSQRGAPLRLAIFDDRLEVENPGLRLLVSPWRTCRVASPSSAIA